MKPKRKAREVWLHKPIGGKWEECWHRPDYCGFAQGFFREVVLRRRKKVLASR